MYFSHLSLTDFRSYESVDVELEPGINAFVGPNGQGKTNLVEALGYVATLGSHRVPSDAALVRAGAARAVVRVRVVRGDRASTIELEITPGRANRARINRSPSARPRDVLGIARTVLFAPEDLALVKGDPDGRRKFLDQLAVLLVPRIAGLLGDYDRVLRQRGALLKSAGSLRGARRRGTAPTRPVSAVPVSTGPADDPDELGDASSPLSTLDVWDARLANLGAEITGLRVQLTTALAPYVAEAYDQLSGGQGEAVVAYRSSVAEALGEESLPDAVGSPGHPSPAPAATAPVAAAPPTTAPFGVDTPSLEDQMLRAMARVRTKEIERGVSLVGPHRDDVVLTLGGLPAKGYASHGESWSLALALRLASYRLLTDGHDALPWASDWGHDGEPILVLDDVFAELDGRRRERLAELVAGAGQVIVTAAVPEDVPERLVGVRFEVQDGTVRRA